MTRNMFERYGGFAAVSKIVMTFYDKVLDSDVVAHYFEGIEMRRLIDHQTKFVSSVMGGPASYTNEVLERVHAHLDIDEEAFREVILLFEETLEDFDLDEGDIAFLVADLWSRAPHIIHRAQHAHPNSVPEVPAS